MSEINGSPEGDQEPSPPGLSPKASAVVDAIRRQSDFILSQMSPEGQRSTDELAAAIRAKYTEAGLDITDPAIHAAALLGYTYREEVITAWKQQGIEPATSDTHFLMALVQAGNAPGEHQPPQASE